MSGTRSMGWKQRCLQTLVTLTARHRKPMISVYEPKYSLTFVDSGGILRRHLSKRLRSPFRRNVGISSSLTLLFYFNPSPMSLSPRKPLLSTLKSSPLLSLPASSSNRTSSGKSVDKSRRRILRCNSGTRNRKVSSNNRSSLLPQNGCAHSRCVSCN